MFLHGEFVNKKGNTIRVEILTDGISYPSYEIGDEASGIYFGAEDPVVIESEINDTFDAILTHSATITLESARELSGLYCSNCMDARVMITRDGKPVFLGFIEPQTYSQSFNDATDEVEINCIDCLSALQYIRYGNIRSLADYAALKATAGMKKFSEIIDTCINAVNLFPEAGGMEMIRKDYDQSRSVHALSTPVPVFEMIEISELLFLGDDEDSVWTLQDVLREIMAYLDLHIEQEGTLFRIFCWETAKQGKGGNDIELTVKEAADTGTSIEIGETYNYIALTCQTDEVETVIQSPFSEESLTYPYRKRQKYLTTCSTSSLSASSDLSTYNKFRDFCLYGTISPTEYTKVIDYYIRVLENPRWKFYDGLNDMIRSDVYSFYVGGGFDSEGNPIPLKPQENLPNGLNYKTTNEAWPSNPKVSLPGACLIGWGSVEVSDSIKDNSLVSSVDMDKYLVISTGSWQHLRWENTTQRIEYPTPEILLNCAPLAEYTDHVGFMMSPQEEGSVNYLVFSGSIRLSPVVPYSLYWKDREELPDFNDESPVVHTLWEYVTGRSVRDKNGARLYVRKWWKTEEANGPVIVDEERELGMCPPDEDGQEMFEYLWNAEGWQNGDRTSKIPVLACMLVIGDKCLVETGVKGRPEDYEWRHYKTLEECESREEYFSQVFYIGYDPKRDEYAVGPEHEIQNNISYEMGLDMEGMAIPISKDDELSGKLEFKILGPVNMKTELLNDRVIDKWWEGQPTGTTVLPVVSNIYVKDFEVKFVNGDAANDPDGGESDLIYISDTDQKYINKKDDITFRIVSALTPEEREALNVKGSASLSTPVNLVTRGGVLKIYDTVLGREGKPEQLYVDAAWNECHLPRVQMTQTVTDNCGLNRFDRYTHPALPGKMFFTLGMSLNLMEGEATLKLREIGND